MDEEQIKNLVDSVKNELNNKIDKIINYIDKKEEEENEPIQEEIVY